MDLQNFKIRFGTLLADERAKEILVRAFPVWVDSPLLRLAESMPLYKVLKIASGHVEQEKLDAVIKELERL